MRRRVRLKKLKKGVNNGRKDSKALFRSQMMMSMTIEEGKERRGL
jgi:hypothetical protein